MLASKQINEKAADPIDRRRLIPDANLSMSDFHQPRQNGVIASDPRRSAQGLLGFSAELLAQDRFADAS
jgi:hypothetical protein